MAEALLTLENILVRHGSVTVLDIPRLEIHPSETLALIGPNGAGKTTLLRVMGLLQAPSSGTIRFHGERANGENTLAMRRRMASIFQEPLLLNASLYDNAVLGLKIRGLGRGEMRRRVLPWLERLGIADLAARRTRTLSGGELQRANLARALVLEPELLLLDEPFSSLDPATRESLLIDLRDILRQTGVTAVFVTHDRHEAFMLGSRVGVLNDGKLLQLGAGAEVFTRPINERVADIVGADTRIRAVVEECGDAVARLRFEGGAIEMAGDFRAGTAVLLCLRPEDIHLHRNERSTCGTGPGHLAVRVVKVIPSTPQSRVVLESASGALVALVPRAVFSALDIHEGDALTASFDPAAVHVIRLE